MVYGSLLRGLQEFDLWPRKPADTIKISVHELASQLQSLGIYVYPTNDFSAHFNRNLVFGFRDQIASTLSSIPNPVLASHRPTTHADPSEKVEGGRGALICYDTCIVFIYKYIYLDQA